MAGAFSSAFSSAFDIDAGGLDVSPNPNTEAMVLVSPPWLRREIGGAIMRSIGGSISRAIARNVAGVALRFPQGEQPDALARIGAERRIRRGPGEDSFSYARRLRRWLDSHQIRGSMHGLLYQLHAYFLDSIGGVIDTIASNGAHHSVDAAGTVTWDRVLSWNGSGVYWARFVAVINTSAATFPVPILNPEGEPALDGSGNPTFTDVAFADLGDEEDAILTAVFSDWKAAHIQCIDVVLRAPTGELWGYAGPDAIGEDVGTWADDDPSPGQTWGGDVHRVSICDPDSP